MQHSNFSMISSDDRVHPAYPAFHREMRDRQYGATTTLDAWLWFKKVRCEIVARQKAHC